jgi:flagellar motor switch protein FliN/FliY
MGEKLSQDEINALLNGTSNPNFEQLSSQINEFTLEEVDALGEIGNISMGTSATTLNTILGHKVTITTPKVSVTTWEQLSKEYTLPYVAVKVEYIRGLKGSNLLILNDVDAKIITDLMMGGKGVVTDEKLTDFHLSAISEAMNQMIGSAATSMSSVFNKRIEISPPTSFVLYFSTDYPYGDMNYSEKIAKISFKMVVGNIIDSEIMQLLPISFAKTMVEELLHTAQENSNAITSNDIHKGKVEVDNVKQTITEQSSKEFGQVNVQPVHFQELADETSTYEIKNMSLILDVPLQVTVELGRTRKLIKEVLEFGPGSIIELDKLAGEPVDILVNGKSIAQGEVVVIDESFGVRITDILHPSERL